LFLAHAFATVFAMDFPSHAKQVFKGKLFEVWQWEQTMFDGSVQTFERVKRPDTVEVIATVGEKIIIEEQEQPLRSTFLSLPGGVADSDDSLREAQRELQEETGYESDDWTLWQSIPFGSSRVVYALHYFLARGCVLAGESKPDAGERITLQFLTFDDFLMLSDEPRFRSKLLVPHLLRMRLDQKKREEFHHLLFPKKAVG
jgi:8-oxo-dGTP pyrophosphatase MutT (NUDIX family)